MYARATGSYKKVALDSATPERVLDEVFTRLLRDCGDARACMGDGRKTEARKHLSHGLELLWALRGALDTSAAPELCANLARLYQYARECLLQASLNMQPEPVVEAENILTDIRAGFHQAGVRAT